PLPQPLANPGVASAVGDLFVIGGGPSAMSLATVSIYDPLTDTWASGSPMQVAKEAFVCAEVNGKIYALGGYHAQTDTRLDDAEVYDPLLDQWATLPPLPGPRADVAGVAVNNKVYVFGGLDNSASLTSTVFEFD